MCNCNAKSGLLMAILIENAMHVSDTSDQLVGVPKNQCNLTFFSQDCIKRTKFLPPRKFLCTHSSRVNFEFILKHDLCAPSTCPFYRLVMSLTLRPREKKQFFEFLQHFTNPRRQIVVFISG